MKRKREIHDSDATLVVRDTVDGGLELIVGDSMTKISKKTVDILKDINENAYKRRSSWKINLGYVTWNQVTIHRMLCDDDKRYPDVEARERWAEHFRTKPNDRLVVGHIDDNRLNFNVENLQKIPETLNLLSQTAKPKKTSSGKFYGSLTYQYELFSTKSVSTEDEAKHAMDILKLQVVPAYFRDYLLKHAMHRPEKYTDRYASVETILSHAENYKKPDRKKRAKRESRNIYLVYRSWGDAMRELPEYHAATIRALFATTGITPFDDKIDSIVHYIGAKGNEIVFVVDFDFYVHHLKDSKPRIKTISYGGYIQIESEYLHLLVMGRKVGQSQKDGLRGGHGAGKVLDNRSRVLNLLTPSENSSDKGDVQTQSAPGLVGVSWSKRNGKWQAHISSLIGRGDQIGLGYFEDKLEAAARYAFARANKEALKKACVSMTDSKARNKYVRRCCEAKTILPNL